MSALNAAPPFKHLFTPELLEQITERRIQAPQQAAKLAAARLRRKTLTGTDGRLNIIAADHTARAVVAAGGNLQAMANRGELLSRIGQILMTGTADGIMATMDVLEELLLLSDLLKGEDRGSAGFMDDKLAIVSLNRGGLSGSVWEMDDPVTGASPERAAQMNFDGIKLLMRVCASDGGSLNTMRYCADAISRANALSLPTFLEPLPVEQRGGMFFVVKQPDSLAKMVGVATALGDSSSYLWLKLPLCSDFDVVAKACTCPILALGGDEPDLGEFTSSLSIALADSHNVRGTMVGRNVLFPIDGDYLGAAEKIHRIVHAKAR